MSLADFADEIANLTLLEKPNGLYKKDKTHNWLQQYCQQDVGSTTEEEEVDSDSGYSSPLHRRNLASSGTQPAQGYTVASVGNVGFVPPHHHAVSQMNPYAPVGYGFGMSSAPPMLSGAYGAMPSMPMPPNFASHAQVPQMRSYAAAASVASLSGDSMYLNMHHPGDKSKDSGKAQKESGKSKKKDSGKASKDSGKNSKPNGAEKTVSGSKASTSAASDDNANKPSGTSQAKKKKKRAGKQRQKSGEEREDEGLLSDEPRQEMVQASPSFGLTAGPAESTSLKRFEDDDFPSLLNAAAGLGSAMSGSSPLYCEALKSPRTSVSSLLFPILFILLFQNKLC